MPSTQGVAPALAASGVLGMLMPANSWMIWGKTSTCGPLAEEHVEVAVARARRAARGSPGRWPSRNSNVASWLSGRKHLLSRAGEQHEPGVGLRRAGDERAGQLRELADG